MDTAGHSEVLKRQKTANAPAQVNVLSPSHSSDLIMYRTEPKRAHRGTLRVL